MQSNMFMKKVGSKSNPRRIYGGASAVERKAARRQIFLEAACQMIGERGFNSVTVRAICKESGITDRYFYESFDSTESLLIATYETVSQELRESLEQACLNAEPTLAAQIGAIVLAYFRFMRDPRKLRILTSEVLGVSERVTAQYILGVSEFADFLHQVTVAIGRAPKEPDKSVILFGKMIIGSFTFAAVEWFESDYDQPAEEIATFTTTFLLGAIERFYD